MLPLPAPYHQADAVLLAQGLTNYTYRLQLQHKSYFYRQGIAQPESLFIDRAQERQTLLLAEAAGLLPKIHYHSADGQQLILDWCDDPSWQMEYFASATGITQLGQLTAQIHAIPARLKILDLADYLQQLMAGLPSLSQTVRQRIEQQQALVDSYKAAGGCCELNRVIQMLMVVDVVSLLWCEKMLLLRAETQYHLLRQQLYRALGIAEV